MYMSCWRVVDCMCMSVEGSYDSVFVCQVEISYDCTCMSGWRIIDCICYVRLNDHTAVYLYVRLKDVTTVSICQVEGSHDYLCVRLEDHRLYLYVSWRIIRLTTIYVRLKCHTNLSIYQVEGLYDSVSTCQVEGTSLKRLRIHKVSCEHKSERSCLETPNTKHDYRFTMPLMYFSSSVLWFFKLRIS